MITLVKYFFAVALGFFLHAHLAKDTASPQSQRRGKERTEENNQGKAAASKPEKRRKSLFDPPEPPPRKEVVFRLEEGQVLKENQVYVHTPEGKAQLERNLGWLIDICDKYALEQRQLAEKKATATKSR